MIKIKIKEAIKSSREHGNYYTYMEIARELWPNSKIETQRVNISRLMNGHTKSVNITHIEKLCSMLKIDVCDIIQYEDDDNQG